MSFFATSGASLIVFLLLQGPAACFGADKPPALTRTAKSLTTTAAVKPHLREVIYFSARNRGKLELCRMNADGSGRVFLSQQRQAFLSFPSRETGNEWEPAVSPDGKHVAFYSDRDGAANLWMMDADGGNQESITQEDLDIAGLDTSLHGQIAFSPGSDTLAFVRGGDIWLYDLRTRLLSSMTKEHGVTGLAWSPDGKSMAFVRNRSLYVTKIGSPVVLMLLSNGISWPTLQFEPKGGKQLLHFQQGAWTVDLDTRTFKRLMSSLVVPNSLAYSPAGGSVCLLSHSPDHQPEVFLATIPEGRSTQVTRGGATDCFFSADGSKVYFLRERRLWIIGVDSKGARPISHTPVYAPTLGMVALPAEAP
jgi:Tol biopolymer transport system component